MNRPLVEAVRGRVPERTPVWVMRQAGRHLPEYRKLRERWSFIDAVHNPEIAAEITLQPIRRYGMDGAVIFADIMTPLAAMGIDVEFAPGPKLRPHSIEQIASLPPLDEEAVAYIGETIRLVRAAVDDDVAVIGFAGAPFTLLAYLLEGGGSKEFMGVRGALHRDPGATAAAFATVARAMRTYLEIQIAAGADVVQLFDSWVGVLGPDVYPDAATAARKTIDGLGAPTIYFAPGGGHLLAQQPAVGADAYGIDWRTSLGVAAETVDTPVQGNLDPAVLLCDVDRIAAATRAMLDAAQGRPHIANLGHGISQHTDPAHVRAFVEAVRR